MVFNYVSGKSTDSTEKGKIMWARVKGKTIKDPYRWLENPKDPEAETWLKKQADFTNEIISKIPGQDALIKDFMTMTANGSSAYSSIVKAGSKYFYHKNNPGDFVPKIYYREGQSGTEILLFDPMEFSPENQSWFPLLSVTTAFLCC